MVACVWYCNDACQIVLMLFKFSGRGRTKGKIYTLTKELIFLLLKRVCLNVNMEMNYYSFTLNKNLNTFLR